MITHTVLFRLNRPVSPEQRQLFVNAVQEFATDPPCAAGPARVRDSLGLRGDSPRTADVLLEVPFETPQAFADYLTHERHQALVTDVLEPGCEGWWSVQAEA